MMRVDEAWLSTEAMDMRAGMDTLLARVVLIFGAARPHHAYLFANARGSRLKIFIQDGYGMWMCTRRLAEGTFSWQRDIPLHKCWSVMTLQSAIVVVCRFQCMSFYIP